MEYNFDEIIERRGTASIKYDFIKETYPLAKEATLPLWVADMDFNVSDAIKEAIIARANKPIFGYSDIKTKEYSEATIKWMKEKHDYTVKENEIFFSPGIVPAIGLLIMALTKENDSILIQQPVYTPFINLVKENKRNLVNSPLIENKNGCYEIDFNDFENKIINEKVKLFILCSPHNPVGRVWTKDELKQIGEICINHNVIVLSDEIHADITRKDYKHIPIASLFTQDNFVSLTAPSKTFNIAGLKMSNIIIKNKEIQNKWVDYCSKKLHISDPNCFVHDTLIAAYTKSEDWYNQLLDYLDENMAFINSFIKENLPKAKFNIPEATFLAWIDLREYNVDYDKLSDLFVTKGNFAIQHGSMFGKEGTGFFRLNAGCPREIIKTALTSMKKVLDEL